MKTPRTVMRRNRYEVGRRQRMETSLTLVRPDGSSIRLGSLTDQVYSFQDEEGWQYHVRHDIQRASL